MHGKILILIFINFLIAYVKTQRIKTLLVQEWAETFGAKIYEISAKATALNKVSSNFIDNGATITKMDGMDVVQSMANRIEGMLQSKVEAVKRLVDTAEEAYKEYAPNKDIDINYYNAKEVVDANSGQIPEDKIAMAFKPHEQFDNIPINLTYSTIHVPTNVYNRDGEVLNNIAWSEKLNRVYVDNYNRDRTLMWQYFGSETGFFRIFPGIKWELDKTNIDLYDCRVKDWYIQAATSPKDLVILLDGSGSMTGLRIEIAKLTIETIMNTLSDDDFFNVIQFTGEALFVEGCFNDTLVQGNEDNKNKIKDKFDSIYTKEIARFDVALTKAFELLNATKESNKGTNCNQAIMIITDGAPEKYQELFETFNKDKHVRIFTYLIGREATDNNGQLKWMSCHNKGYFTHIATLADVQENVQEYIKVISRPMVIEQEHVTIWTGIYHTKADPKTKNWLNLLEEEMDSDTDTIRLMTSVAQPVFDRKNSTHGEGNLLGVMGTDVPIEEIIKLTPQYKLGPNGYPFAITNNGYILFHPDLRPMYGKQTKPNYNSVDLSEVELSEQENPYGRNYDMKLRKEMLDQKASNHTMNVKIAHDMMRRVDMRTHHYFYTTLLRTPFSLGIALPENRLYMVKGTVSDLATGVDIERDFGGSLWKVVPDWVYCRLPNEENKLNDRARIVSFIKLAQASSSPSAQGDKFQDEYRFYTENCDKELIASLAFDAKVTAPILPEWNENEAYSQSHGIELVFLGTRSGLTRYYEIKDKVASSNFGNGQQGNNDGAGKNNPVLNTGSLNYIEKHSKALEELYYKRADAAGPNRFVFSVEHNNFPDYTFALQEIQDDNEEDFTRASVGDTDDEEASSDSESKSKKTPDFGGNVLVPSPFNGSFYREELEPSNGLYYPGILVTASSPVVIKAPGSTKPASGLNGKSPSDPSFDIEEELSTAAVVGLRMGLDSLAQIFYNTSTSIDCFVEGTMCYLLDENAYVILSSANNPRHIGKFFGQVDGRIMHTLANHVYKKVALYDFQAMCETKVSLFSRSSPLLRHFLAPLISVLRYTIHTVNQHFWKIVVVPSWQNFIIPRVKPLYDLVRNELLTKSLTQKLLKYGTLLQGPSLIRPINAAQKEQTTVRGKITKHPVLGATINAPAGTTPSLTPKIDPTSSEDLDDDERPNDIKIFKAPHPCEKRYNLFTLNRYLLANEGPVSLISNCGGKPSFSPITTKYDKLRFCGKPFIVSLIPYTNLVLIVVRKAQSSFFDASAPSGNIGTGPETALQSSLTGSAANKNSTTKKKGFGKKSKKEKAASYGTAGSTSIQDICSLCDDLVFNYQPKGISLVHEEVLDDASNTASDDEEDFEDLDEEEAAELLKQASAAMDAKSRSGFKGSSSAEQIAKLLLLKKKRKRLMHKNKCYGIKTHVYRRRPTTCYSHNKLENTAVCGRTPTAASTSASVQSYPIRILPLSIPTIITLFLYILNSKFL